MGLKTSNYTVEKFGVTLPTAYAQIKNVDVSLEGKANAVFEIQQTREDIGTKSPLERKFFSCVVNKDLPIHKQVYSNAKTSLFPDWEDDIVE